LNTKKKSSNNLLSINKNSPFIEEANSRLVRHYMGEGNLEKSKEYFKKTIALNNENIWVYIHYSEVIQPKWGGNLKDIKDLLNNLPKRKLIKQIISLKLALDSYISNENYFGGTMEELDNIANQLLVEIDRQVTKSPPISIHRYIVYNYLFALAEELKNNPLQFKNYQKMNEFFTLYPYGIQV
jgi:tetratricopeptide (TPR) repeat protein